MISYFIISCIPDTKEDIDVISFSIATGIVPENSTTVTVMKYMCMFGITIGSSQASMVSYDEIPNHLKNFRFNKIELIRVRKLNMVILDQRIVFDIESNLCDDIVKIEGKYLNSYSQSGYLMSKILIEDDENPNFKHGVEGCYVIDLGSELPLTYKYWLKDKNVTRDEYVKFMIRKIGCGSKLIDDLSEVISNYLVE